MDIRNIYVIVGKGYTLGKVKEELRLEKYNHNFVYGDMVNMEEKIKYLIQADEVWTFGDIVENQDYRLALVNLKDIWVMG